MSGPEREVGVSAGAVDESVGAGCLAPTPGSGAGSGNGDAPVGGRRRSRAVLYSCVAAAVVIAVLVGVFASSKPLSASNASSPLVGKPAPAVSGTSVTGSGSYSLAQYSGRWVLLNFSASWCVPCQQETPQLVTFESEHQSKGNAIVLAVEFDPTDTSNLAAFLKKNDATWPAISDDQAQVAYGVTGIPESYLVDPQGSVVAKFTGGITAAQVDKVIDQSGDRA